MHSNESEATCCADAVTMDQRQTFKCVCVEGGGVRAKNVETQQYIDSIAISGYANTSSSVAGENESPSSVFFYSFIFTTFIKTTLYIIHNGTWILRNLACVLNLHLFNEF